MGEMTSQHNEPAGVDCAPEPDDSPPKSFVHTKQMREKLEYIEGYLPPSRFRTSGSLLAECERLGLPVTDRARLSLTEQSFQLMQTNHTTVQCCGQLVLKKYEDNECLWSFFAEAVTMTEARPLRGFQKLVGVIPEERILVTEYVGRNLAQVLYQDKPSLLKRLEIVKEVVKICEEMHSASIVHNDLQPSNICVREREGGEGPEFTIIDFSLACFTKERVRFAPKEVYYPHFAPELRKGNRRPSSHSDIYSIAHMLKHEIFRDAMDQLTVNLKQWIESGLQRSKHLRRDLKALQAALKEAAIRVKV